MYLLSRYLFCFYKNKILNKSRIMFMCLFSFSDGDYEFDSGDQMLADYMEFLLENEIAFEQAFVQYD